MATQVYNATGGGLIGLFPNPIISDRDPTTTDRVSPTGQPYQIFQGWNNRLTDASFIYLGSGNWVTIAAITGAVTQLTGNAGVALPVGGNINIVGTGTLSFAGAGSTITGTITPGTGLIATLTGDSGGARSPTAGNMNLLGTASQITVTGAASTLTWSLPVAIIAPGSLTTTTSLTATTTATAASFITSSATIGTTFTDNSIIPTGSDANIDLLVSGKGTGGVIQSRGLIGSDLTIEVTNTDNTNAASRAGFEAAVGGASAGDPYVNFLVSGAGVYTIGIDNSVSDDFVIAASAALGTSNIASWTSAGALTNAGGITATLGNITATNGNLVLGTAGNKISITTGANASAGSDTLAGGTVTVNTTAVTASSIILLTRQSIGATGAAATGNLTIGTVVAGTSFVINSVQPADATALQASDVSVIGWVIIN